MVMHERLYLSLTVNQPWASLIAIGEKSIENREWRPPHRFLGATIIIHAGKAYDHLGSFELKVKRGIDCYAPHLPHGAAVAIARLTSVVTASDNSWFSGPYGWVFEDIQAIEPVPCAGKPGLWQPDDELRQRVIDAAHKPFDLSYYFRPPNVPSDIFSENTLTS